MSPVVALHPEPSFAAESIASILRDGAPLAKAHWDELMSHLGPFDPDFDGILALESAGVTRSYSARLDGALVGYAGFLLGKSINQKTVLQAGEFAFFLAPEYRRGTVAARLAAFADACLVEEGVREISYHVRTAHPALGVILSRRGYTSVETTYTKRF